MLRKIEVSGFRSLNEFSLEFRKGLNVIVGPNGSGKTNVINFIEFLSHLARSSLLDAVSMSGGAGRIFRRDAGGNFDKEINFRIFGGGTYSSIRSQVAQRTEYEYSASVVLAKSTLFYKSQRLKFWFDGTRNLGAAYFDIEVISPDADKLDVLFHAGEEFLVDRYSASKREDNTEAMKFSIREAMREYGRNVAIFQLMDRYMDRCRSIIFDLYRARSFNVVPSQVRKPQDIASEPDIHQDGSGLAAVLFSMKNTRSAEDYYYPFYRPPLPGGKETLRKIISYSKIVNDSIDDIEVESDPIENQLRIFVSVSYEGGYLRLPFSLVSDGTVKWLTLITAILISKSVFAIEEPENFLHPLMQKEIVNIIRQSFLEDGNEDRFALMTTHSETILNYIDPDEMILIRMEQGRTIAGRPINADEIREEIQRTGFGAGYYYLAGAIE